MTFLHSETSLIFPKGRLQVSFSPIIVIEILLAIICVYLGHVCTLILIVLFDGLVICSYSALSRPKGKCSFNEL